LAKNIVLLGFMGTGKSIVGRRLAVELKYRFIDTDHFIEKRTQRRIPDIFAEDGETVFRDLEAQAVLEVAAWSGYVIATGGGVPLNKANVEALQGNGILVTLTARPDAILRRVQRRAGQRPLLNNPDPLGEIVKLLSQRESAYRCADIQVDTSDIPVEKSVNLIIDQIKPRLGAS